MSVVSIGLCCLWVDSSGCKKLGVDIQPVGRDRIGNQGFLSKLVWQQEVSAPQWMIWPDHQDLLVIKDRREAQSRLIERIRRHQHVNLVAEQRADAAELEFLADIDLYPGPAIQVGRHDFEQPLVTGMALHADAQRAPLAFSELSQPLFGMGQLRQQAVGDGKQKLAGLGGLQAAALAPPDFCTDLVFQLGDRMAERRLGQVQLRRRRGQRPLALDLADDRQMDAFQDCHVRDSNVNQIHQFMNSYHFHSWNQIRMVRPIPPYLLIFR